MKNKKNQSVKEESMVKNLKDAKQILDENGVEFWLDWGTLLGAIREKKIIEWDCDLDLGTFNKNWEKVLSLVPKFKEKGFEIKPIRNLPVDRGIFYRKILFSRFGYSVDLCFYHLKGENFIHPWMDPDRLFSKILNIAYALFFDASLLHSLKTRSRTFVLEISKFCVSILSPKLKKSLSHKIGEAFKKHCSIDVVIVPSHYFKKFKKIKFYNTKFKVPLKSTAYLGHKFGKDWKVPQKEWGGYKDILKIR